MLPLIVGGLSGYFTASNIATWYVTLNKPFFNPPNYLFGPVWTVLYLMMGISLGMIINAKHSNKNKSLIIFSIQLVLNFFWSVIFFSLQSPGWAAIEIIAMWLSIIYMIRNFYKINKWAGWLQIPYLLWVTFASVLNISIYVLN
ncbi:MAG: TspO/MBR family protein [Bacteroidota bacterium]|jgi:tryptophan-rich sensory protein